MVSLRSIWTVAAVWTLLDVGSVVVGWKSVQSALDKSAAALLFAACLHLIAVVGAWGSKQ